MIRFLGLLLFLGQSAIPEIAAKLPRIHVDPSTGHFVDETGNVRLFHGINSVIKGFPWYDHKLLDPQRRQDIADLGFNVIRLGAMWTGVEPEEGQYNRTYIDILKEITTEFGKLGVYVLLDMHQDVLWKAGPNEDNGYWGVPKWIKDKMTMPERLYPWPLKDVIRWECGYFTEEVSRGFGQFYKNVGGTADSFAKYWGFMANEFKDFTSVLGYELINEPFAGDLFESSAVLLPGLAGSRNLAPLYDKAAAEIRAVDHETILFWEPVTWAYFFPVKANPILDDALTNIFDNLTIYDLKKALNLYCGEIEDTALDLLNTQLDLFKSKLFKYRDETDPEIKKQIRDSVFGPGLTQVPGGPDYNNRTVMSWHYYCWAMDLNGGSSNDPANILTQLFCDTILGPNVFQTAHLRAGEIGGGHMLTEFGLCAPNISNPISQNTIECNAVLELAEFNFESYTYWDTADGGIIWDWSGNVKPEVATVFSRPFPIITSGSPVKLRFDVFSKEFEYEFSKSSGENSEVATEIFIPELNYPEFLHAFSVEISTDLLGWKFEGGVLMILDKEGASPQSNKTSFVKITKRDKDGLEEEPKVIHLN